MKDLLFAGAIGLSCSMALLAGWLLSKSLDDR